MKSKDYIIIKINQESLWKLLCILFLIIAFLTIMYIPYLFGEDQGYNKGLKDGVNREWNNIVDNVDNYGQVELDNLDGSANMTLEKYHSCYTPTFRWGNPEDFGEGMITTMNLSFGNPQFVGGYVK